MRLPNRSYVDRLLKNAYEQHGNEIQIIPYNPRPSNIYGETLGKSYGNPITLLGYLETEPTALKLQELGWSKDMAEIIIRVPFISLLDVGLAEGLTLKFSTDDKIFIPSLDKDFQMSKTQLREPFINGQPTFVWIGGKKFTHGR
jgi:hypothetical protein